MNNLGDTKMALPSSYTQAYGKIGEFFGKIRDGQAPDQFSTQLLKDLGYKSNNHRAFIPIMKSLGFLSPDGKPTSRYNEYRDHSKSKQIMGEAIKDAYSDIFLIKEHPTAGDKATIEGKFKSYHNVSDNISKIMANTFYALLSLADLKTSATTSVTENNETNKKNELDNKVAMPQISNKSPGLHYNIQVHLPATKDIEVYNAIFKSLREHLF
jgi:Family of unknown function (DUF5343)